MVDYESVISLLKSDDYYQVKKRIYELINDSNFIRKIVKEKNPFVFDRFAKMCEYKMDTSIIYDERKKYLKKLINSLTVDNCQEKLGLDDLNIPLVNRYLTEYIISYYFEDNYYNLMTNFYQMISYLRDTGKKLVNVTNIELYQRFLNVSNLSFNEKIRFFNDYLDDNIMELFYDDMEIVRTDSHKELVNQSLKLSKNSSLYQKDLSEKYGLNIYMLDGEDFYGFVRCLSIKTDDTSDHKDYVESKGKRLGSSFSFIGKHNIGTTDYDGNCVTLFYDNIDYRNIMYVHHADLHVNNMVVQNDYLSLKENEITTPSSLVNRIINYSEIYIKGGVNGIKAKALVCYDKITTNDIIFANKYDLDILIINREKYKRYETYDEEFERNTYVI